MSISLALLGLALHAGTTTFAAPALHKGPEPHCAVRIWDTNDGLPQNSVVDVEKLSDGVLALATLGGFALFNGTDFSVEDLSTSGALRSNRFLSIELIPDRGLVAATQDGRLQVREDAQWVPLELVSGTSNLVLDIKAGIDGEIWLATTGGIQRIERGATKSTLVREGAFHSLVVTDDGHVFTNAASGQGLWMLAGQTWSQLLDGSIMGLTVASNGQVWGVRDLGLFRINPDFSSTSFDLPFQAVQLCSDQMGGLYVLGERELIRVVDGELNWRMGPDDLKLGEAGRMVSVWANDGGRVWIGTQASGLVHVYPSPLGMLPITSGEEPHTLSVIRTTSGDIFTMGQEVFQLTDEGVAPVNLGLVRCFAAALEGGFWFVQQATVWRWLDGVVSPLDLAFEEDGWPIMMIELEGGTLAMVNHTSLLMWDGTTMTQHVLPDVHGRSEPTSFQLDGQGQLWIGGAEYVHKWDGSRFKTWRSGEGIPFGSVRSFCESKSGMWVGTYGGGMFHLRDDEVTVFDGRNGLRENIASALIPFGEQLLVVGNRSVALYEMAALDALVKGERHHIFGRVFDSGIGIDVFESNAQLSPRFALDDNGSAYFPALGGLAWFDPRMRDPEPLLAPTRVRVEYSEVAELSAESFKPAEHVLQAESRDVRFRFDSPTFIYPRQTLFRYRLAGLEEEWNYAREPIIVAYRDLYPGDYTFEIQTALADGPFGPLNDMQRVHVPRLWFEEPFVRGGAILLGLGLIIGFGFLRAREANRRNRVMEVKINQRTAMLSQEVTERKRIENELRQASEHLEKQVQFRTEELARALTNLESDVQRREKLEGRLREAEKLEAVGRLAGGLAHDFNNILTAIMGEVDIATSELNLNSSSDTLNQSIQAHIKNIRDAGQRAASLTKQLLAYSRQQIMQPRVVNPYTTLLNLEPMLQRLVPENVEIQIDPPQNDAAVLIDPSQLEQVIVNLFVNAAEAMPEGGRIDVSLRTTTNSLGEAVVELAVRDTGPGFPPEDRERLFEPFFSTKGPARGLGLASVHGIVLQSKGEITVDSSSEQGTTFRILLPLTTRDVQPTPSPRAATLPTNLRVLLIDDENEVRRVARQMLQRAGLLVTDTDSPEHALQIMRDAPDGFDVLVTDVVMPRMNGKQLADQVRLVCPHLKVLFISGYSAEVLGERELLADEANLLAKPFDSQALCQRISELFRVPNKA
jgi:signal transduction histidine kinase/ligand-binding sensor domain-containing protein